MCSICLHNPCLSRCPNAPEPQVFAKCYNCGEPIYYEDDYYEFGDEKWCVDCVDDCRHTAYDD